MQVNNLSSFHFGTFQKIIFFSHYGSKPLVLMQNKLEEWRQNAAAGGRLSIWGIIESVEKMCAGTRVAHISATVCVFNALQLCDPNWCSETAGGG